MSDSRAHLSDWTLEQLAEGMLPEAEHQGATAHLEGCRRCAAELDSYRTLFSALADLPRFAPSPTFGDAVMTRIHIGPRPSPVLEKVRRWLPVTRKGWMLLAAALIAPALPVLALVAWLFSQPMISASALLHWGSHFGAEATNAALSTIVRWETQLGITHLVNMLYSTVASLPLEVLLAGGATLVVGIPLSAWSLIRLVRTPMGDVHYAN